MPIYNLIKYSKNYRKTTGSLWNYYRDELSNYINDNNSPNKKSIKSKSFKYKTSITGSTYHVDEKITNAGGNDIDNTAYGADKVDTKEVEIAVPIKYLSKFWRPLDMPLINCEVGLFSLWSANCVITSMKKREVTAAKGNPGVPDDSPTGATFKITDTKLYVPVVTLSTQDNNKLLEQLKIGFTRTIKWNKYRSEMSNQAIKNLKNLNYLTDPIFIKAIRLFVL